MISLIEKIPFGTLAGRAHYLYCHVPQSLLNGIAHDNFRKTVVFAAQHSTFYRRKFAEFHIDPSRVRAPEDLGNFFTTAEDIRNNPDEFLCAKPDTAFETTGTTSKKSKRVYFSRQELREAGFAGAVGLWAAGLRPEDRVASAFDYSFWISGPVLQSSCEVIGCFHVEAGRMDVEEFYDRLKDYRLSVIVGDPSWVLHLSHVAEKKGAWPLKLLVAGGENMTESARRYIESVWKADLLLSYGQTEALGTIGCESRAKDGYRLNDFHNRFEIVDRDNEGYGELVYTTLNRRVMPLIRYRTGDITRFLDGESPGHLPGARVEKLKGRTNEWTATGLGNLAPWMFEPVFNAVGDIGPDWQIVIDKENDLDHILLNVEADATAEKTAAIKAAVLKQIELQLGDAWRSQKLGLGKFDIQINPPQSLRSGRKLSRFVDNRKF